MKIRLNGDYYSWRCDWCDTENRVLWERMPEGAYCGACHKPFHAGKGMAAMDEAALLTTARKIMYCCL